MTPSKKSWFPSKQISPWNWHRKINATWLVHSLLLNFPARMFWTEIMTFWQYAVIKMFRFSTGEIFCKENVVLLGKVSLVKKTTKNGFWRAMQRTPYLPQACEEACACDRVIHLCFCTTPSNLPSVMHVQFRWTQFLYFSHQIVNCFFLRSHKAPLQVTVATFFFEFVHNKCIWCNSTVQQYLNIWINVTKYEQTMANCKR